MVKQFAVVVAILGALAGVAYATSADQQRDTVVRIVAQIQRADYEGDRVALKTLYSELAPFLQSKELASRVHYWRGFALWRRALNGFNDSNDPAELRGDLEQAVKEFDEAVVQDPQFVDAKIGAGSCLSNLMYLSQNDAARLRELIPKARQALKEAAAQAPDNPRLYWVLGPNAWYAPNEGERGQQKAMEMYEKGLAAARANKSESSDPLSPSWGEPELLMNLAWSNLHRTTPDLKAAKAYAESALKSIPYWHYVRDILLPQIEGAIRAQEHTERESNRDGMVFGEIVGNSETIPRIVSWLFS